MAQSAPLQAQVERTTVGRSAPASVYSPVETNRKNEATGITLSVPLFGKNAFLVVRLPKAAVDDLITEAAKRPEPERNAFIREWVKENQVAIYDQYMAAGGNLKHFKYDIIPASATKLSSVPVKRPVEPEQPKSRRLEQTPHIAVERPKPDEPYKMQIPPLPREVTGGKGDSKKNAYVIEPAANREKDEKSIGSTAIHVSYPIVVEDAAGSDHTIYLQVNYTLSQLRGKAHSQTQQDVRRIMTDTIKHFLAEHNIDPNSPNTQKSIHTAMTSVMQLVQNLPPKVANTDANTRSYLGL